MTNLHNLQNLHNRKHTTVKQNLHNRETKQDLNIIIGNTFDNAIEECATLVNRNPDTEPEIKVSLIQMNDMLFFEITNPCAQVSHKKPGSIHGYGLQNARRCVEKYNGSMSNGVVDGQYRVSICLDCAVNAVSNG